MLEAIITGVVLASGLILGLGPQNMYVIRQGLRGKFLLPVVLTCSFGDIVLITVGALGVGSFLSQNVLWQLIVGALGTTFLLVYGAMSFKAAFKPHTQKIGEDDGPKTWPVAVSTVAALTFLNPWAIMDTIVVIGGVAAQYADFMTKLSFVASACLVSFVWFFFIGYGAKRAHKLFENPKVMKGLDIFVGLMMWSISYALIIKLWPLYKGM